MESKIRLLMTVPSTHMRPPSPKAEEYAPHRVQKTSTELHRFPASQDVAGRDPLTAREEKIS